MAKVSKQFKKFAASGKLKDTIKARRQHQQKRRKFDEKVEQRKKQRGAPQDEYGVAGSDGEEDEDDAEDRKNARSVNAARGGRAGGVAKNVEELFGQGGLDVEDEQESELEDLDSEGEDEDEGEDDEDDADEDEGLLDEAAMKKTIKSLEKTDPEFFKYLKENDSELLDFGAEAKGKGKKHEVDEDEDMEDDDEDEERDGDDDDDDDEAIVDEARAKTSVTLRMLREWQNGMIKQHSLRSLRKTLLAFRAAAHMNEDEGDQGSGRDVKYTIDSAQVFNKVVLTALKYTPVVLSHHIPYKTLANGRVKVQQAKNPNQSLNRLILSHFSTLLHLIKSLPSHPSSDEAGGLLSNAVTESTKLLPWVLGARKHLRAYLKVLLELWTTASDSVRIASFLAVRKAFIAGDDALKDLCLRNTYRQLLPCLRNTSVHTLPSINLIKNTAAELFALDAARSYPQAFNFIRTLAIHLRTVVRSTTSGTKDKTDSADAFRAVYNWQYVHAVDFWSQVLASSADIKVQAERGGLESPLKPLIYPLTQIALGVIRLLPSSRYFPLRFHLVHSLLRLITRTGTYIPLSPFLLEILDSAEFRRSNPKKATLKPLDLEYVIRAPAAYPKTRIYQETLGDELVFLLAEYHTAVANNVAFPEMVLPVIVAIKRHLKKGSAGSPKVQASLKTLVDKLEATRQWVESKRRNVSFAPRDRAEVCSFEDKIKVEDSPVGNWTRVQRKVREAKRRQVEKALRQEAESEGSGEDGEME